MGNGCFCLSNINNQYQEDIKLDSLLEAQIQNDKENDQLEVTNLYNIVRYFNEGEKEINSQIEKKNIKRLISHKKAKNTKSYNMKGDSKYELMLKRLLDQKSIERKGPKRRKTLRTNNNEEIKKLIENVIIENINNENDNKNKNQKIDNSKRESILLNYRDKKNIKQQRQSFNINKFDHKNIKNNFEDTEINNALMLNDIKNINNATSNYISDANYICKPKNFSPNKQ